MSMLFDGGIRSEMHIAYCINITTLTNTTLILFRHITGFQSGVDVYIPVFGIMTPYSLVGG